MTVLGRESPFALYSADLASMEIEGGGAAFDYNPYDAQVRFMHRAATWPACRVTEEFDSLTRFCHRTTQGFIRINAVRLRAYNHLQRTFDAK